MIVRSSARLQRYLGSTHVFVMASSGRLRLLIGFGSSSAARARCHRRIRVTRHLRESGPGPRRFEPRRRNGEPHGTIADQHLRARGAQDARTSGMISKAFQGYPTGVNVNLVSPRRREGSSEFTRMNKQRTSERNHPTPEDFRGKIRELSAVPPCVLAQARSTSYRNKMDLGQAT